MQRLQIHYLFASQKEMDFQKTFLIMKQKSKFKAIFVKKKHPENCQKIVKNWDQIQVVFNVSIFHVFLLIRWFMVHLVFLNHSLSDDNY